MKMLHINKTETLESKQDASVNFVSTGEFPGMLEARYVRRRDDYFIAYLSAQTGCRQACRFCHLTATGQTIDLDAPPSTIFEQAERVLGWYDKQVQGGAPRAKVVHFSFMARGEPLVSEYLRQDGDYIVRKLYEKGRSRQLLPRVMISTILPTIIKGRSLTEFFPTTQPNIYYSIYSMNPEFRKKWLPKALPAEEGLDMLKDYQEHTNKIVKLHWAFIKGENDHPTDVAGIVDAVNARKLRVDVNIVRYNPFSDKHGQESDVERIILAADVLKDGLPGAKIKVVDRVGADVKASCGMFVKEDEVV